MTKINVHASCVRLGKAGRAFGASAKAGVLILGESGAGKSDLVLRLIERRAILVADDRTDLTVRNGKLCASPPKPIAGYLEVRGLGIVELPYAKSTTIALVVQLSKQMQRLPVHKTYAPPKPLSLAKNVYPPMITIDPFEESAPAKIALAAAAFPARLFREKVKPE